MGGSVFNKDRVSYNRAVSVANEIIEKIKNNTDIFISSYHMPKYKETYGDLDFVVYLNNHKIEDIINLLSPCEAVNNSKILQMLYKDIQIDINIIDNKESFNFASHITMHSVLPAFISYIIPVYSNFRFHLNGIYVKKHSEIMNKYVDCLVTTDFCSVLHSIGLSEEILKEDISRENVIDLIKNSKFIPDSKVAKNTFLHAVKDKIGTSYCHSYLMDIFNALDSRDYIPKLEDCKNHFYSVFKEIRNDSKEKEIFERKYLENTSFKRIFNGKVINKISGITGKDIGYVMDYYKNSYSKREDLVNHINSLNETDFKNEILSILNYKGENNEI